MTNVWQLGGQRFENRHIASGAAIRRGKVVQQDVQRSINHDPRPRVRAQGPDAG
jgi:hypothetical protein